MKKLTWALWSLMLLLCTGVAFADEGVTVTLNPADGATVIDGTSVTVTLDVPAGHTVKGISYGLAETKAEAEAMTYLDLDDYDDTHKPVITAAKTVLRVRVISEFQEGEERPVTTEQNIYGEYTIATGAIASPVILVNGDPIQGYEVSPDAMISIQRGEGDNTSERWYTTDGSTPEKDGANSIKFGSAFMIGEVLAEGAESVTIKAIAVDGEQTSAVVMATFTVATADINLMFVDMMTNSYLTDVYGRYVELMPMVFWGEEPASYQMYYTIDGETEPSEEAFDKQTGTDGPIYMISYNPFDDDAEPSFIMFTENTTDFKAAGMAMTMSNQQAEFKINRTLTAIEIDNPMLTGGTEDGKSVLKISNYSTQDWETGEEQPNFDYIYYTTDGTVPSAMSMTEGTAEMYDPEEGIALPQAGQTIKLIGFKGEQGGATAGSEMIEIALPAAPTFDPADKAKVDFGAELTLNCATEGAWIIYTLDGTEPSLENENIGYYSERRKPGITARTVKAVAVLYDVLYSEVAEATYDIDLKASLSLVPLKDDTVGMNVGTGFEFSVDGWEEYPGVAVYYTVDGTTEPTKAAYEAQDADGAIKMLTVKTKEYEYDGETYTEILKTDGHALAITFKEATHLKAIGYITLLDKEVVTPLLDEELQIKAEAKPAFSLADGAEVTLGSKLVIENPNPYPEAPEMPEYPEYPGEDATEEELAAYEEAVKAWEEEEAVWSKEMEKYREAIADIPATVIYYSFDGTEPTSAACDQQREGEAWSVFKTQEGQNVNVFFRKDDKGYYAYVPEIMGYISPADTLRLPADITSFTLKAMAVTTEGKEGGDGPMPLSAKAAGGDFAFMYGSDFAVAEYKVVAPAAATLTFDPASGTEVYENTEVTITANQEVDIFYMMFESKEAAEAAEWDQEKALSYSSELKPVVSKKLNTIKAAYAFNGSDILEAEFFYATYTVKELPAITLTFNPASGSEVEDNTTVTVTANRETEIFYNLYAGKEAADADTTFMTNAKEVTEDGMPVITKEATYLRCAVTDKGEMKYFYATYTVKDETPIDPSANEAEELAGVTVYPNPNNGLFNIELPVAATVEVFASNGVLVQRVKANAGNVSMNINRSGIYVLRITGEGRTTVKRVIVR